MIPRPPRSTHCPYTTLFRSPKLRIASHHTFVALSVVLKGRSPNTWHTELTDQVTWWPPAMRTRPADRKSTRLNSSHANISSVVFCLTIKNIPLLLLLYLFLF